MASNTMQIKWLYGCLTILFALHLFSCAGEDKSLKVDDLDGDWTLVMATRDGQETGTLDDLFIDFDGANLLLRTNLFGETDEYAFNLKNNKIILDDNKLEIEVYSLDDGILEIGLNINNTPFKLWFEK